MVPKYGSSAVLHGTLEGDVLEDVQVCPPCVARCCPRRPALQLAANGRPALQLAAGDAAPELRAHRVHLLSRDPRLHLLCLHD
eukprot:4814371-Prymnesium_polylepis.1